MSSFEGFGLSDEDCTEDYMQPEERVYRFTALFVIVYLLDADSDSIYGCGLRLNIWTWTQTQSIYGLKVVVIQIHSLALHHSRFGLSQHCLQNDRILLFLHAASFPFCKTRCRGHLHMFTLFRLPRLRTGQPTMFLSTLPFQTNQCFPRLRRRLTSWYVTVYAHAVVSLTDGQSIF
jgi:hypothetical protein